MMIKLTEKEAEFIFQEGANVDELEWRDEGKYSFGGVIFEKEGKNYLLRVTRSGSYYSDYDYGFRLDCPEVIKATKTVEYWKEVA